MPLPNISAAVEQAVLATESLAAGKDDCEPRLALHEWIDDNLHRDAVFRDARRLALATDLQAYSYLLRAMRSVSTVVEVTTDGVGEVLCLFAIPMFLAGPRIKTKVKLPHWEFRGRIERRLEEVMGLGMASVRLNRFPVEQVPLAEMNPSQIRHFLHDLHTYGDSKLVNLPTINREEPGMGLLWPGMVRFRKETYEEESLNFRTKMSAPGMREFMQFASATVTAAMVEVDLPLRVSMFPPTTFPDAFSTYRILKLTRAVRDRMTEKVRSIVYRFKAGLLTLWLLNEEEIFQSVIEMDFAEDNPSVVRSALRRLELKHGITCTERADLPQLPRAAVEI